MKRIAGMLALFLLLLAALGVKGGLLSLPAPPDAPAPGEFDANRAAARLARVLGDQQPHPADSAGNDAVRDRLIAEMRGVGLEPRITDDFACNNRESSRVISCARVRNLVATIGPASGRHVLLVSHYDSTPVGPGAADDGIGVAAMLEIAANLRGRPLARPVSFLFDEGEEVELLGARAFLAHDPLANQVDTIINMEARGVSGPAIMFETSRPNGSAVALYRGSAANPVANSLSTGLYALIPNSTDVTVFAGQRPWTILNFAVIGNETRYHSAGDDLAALSHASLQHMGEQAEAAAEVAASADPPAADGERLYMDLIGKVMIVLPLLFGLILLGLLILFFLLRSWRQRALGLPLLAMAGALAGSGALAFLGHLLIQWLRPGDYWRAFPVVATSAAYAAALAASVAALLLVARTRERTRLRPAFWLLYTLLGAALSAVAPGAAIYFLFPPLAAALFMVLQRWWPRAERVGAITAALLLFLTFGPALGLFEDLLSTGAPWLFAPLGAVILLPLLIELLPLLDRPRPAIGIAFSLVFAGWIATFAAPAYSDDRRQLFAIEYVMDARDHSARLAVNNDGAPVPLAGNWARTELPYSQRRRWTLPAPLVPITAASAEQLLRVPLAGGGEGVRLRLHAEGAETLTLILPANHRLRAAGSSGFVLPFGEAGGSEGRYFLRCVGRSCDGATLDLILDGSGPIDAVLVGSRRGLPPPAAALAAARGPLARPQYGPDATITVSRAQFGGAAPAP